MRKVSPPAAPPLELCTITISQIATARATRLPSSTGTPGADPAARSVSGWPGRCGSGGGSGLGAMTPAAPGLGAWESGLCGAGGRVPGASGLGAAALSVAMTGLLNVYS